MKNKLLFCLLPFALTISLLSVAVGDDVRNKVDPKSLYARVGGQEAINAAVDLFYEKLLADERVNFFFDDVNMKVQIRKQKEFLSAALGGPEPWTGKDMRKAHENLDLREEDFSVVAEHLQNTLVELKLDHKLVEEIMTLVASTKDDVLNKPSEGKK
ncbi:MAG: group 1 truncated hemoglobin [Verrucomicrobiales bacterium]|nr:group 1 truncated hemoglobin [Verrucomicrobiales bacterium]